jgi:hypothetical protein
MATLKKEAEDYKPTQIKNIAELDSVNLDVEFFKETRKKADDTEYSLSFIRVDGEEYRVPSSVLEQIQEIIKTKPKATKVKVVRKGEGMKTNYTTIPLD